MRLLLLLPLLAAPLASAQQSEAFVRQAEAALGSSAEAVTGAQDAEAALSAALVGTAMSANVAAVSQTGVNNEADLTQSGVGNRFGLVVDGNANSFVLSQLGDDNVFLGDVLGNANQLTDDANGNPSVQEGNGNRYTLFLDGVDGRSHSLRQLGGGNEATQVVGRGMQPASIEQRGGATVVIERR